MATVFESEFIQNIKLEGTYSAVSTIYTVPSGRYSRVVINSLDSTGSNLDVTETDGSTVSFASGATTYNRFTSSFEMVLYLEAGQAMKVTTTSLNIDATISEFSS